jgi:hypothetical protein
MFIVDHSQLFNIIVLSLYMLFISALMNLALALGKFGDGDFGLNTGSFEQGRFEHGEF